MGFFRLLKSLVICACGLIASAGWASGAQGPAGTELHLRIPAALASNQIEEDYLLGLLTRALARSAPAGEVLVLHRADQVFSQNRTIALLDRSRELDLLWTMTSREREERMRPIRVPLYRGLLGYRAFLIRPERQVDFARVQSLTDLRSFKAGLDPQWPDTSIMRAGGLQVVTHSRYDMLFDMLRKGRIDYFPRGVNEILHEHSANSDLAVESGLLLVYPAPSYFFVHKDNIALAKRLERGLMAMVEDGSFERYFNEHPLIVNTLRTLNLAGRRVLVLQNPLLPDATPLQDIRLWLIPTAKPAPASLADSH